MTPFELSFMLVVGLEGKYSDDPNDPGGETKYGISKRYHPDLDIKNLTLDQARDVYEREYWRPTSCDSLPMPLAAFVFDMAVNQGVGTAAKTVQSAVGSTPDGKIGALTMARVHAAEPIELTSLFMADRSIRYFSDSGFDRYGRGWLKRCFKLAYELGQWEPQVSS